MKDLIMSPEPDQFKTETPKRAFTEWRECGLYAMGRGFRPSVAHIPVYLDALETKEGWQLVQLVPSHSIDSGDTMLFRKVAE